MKYLLCIIIPLLWVACQSQVAIHPFGSYDVKTFQHIINSKANMVIIDVRTPAETHLGKIEGAIEMDLKASSFMDKIQALDKSVPYALYCRSGRRSKLAMSQMKMLGFKEVYDLDKGYNAWVKSKK